MEGKRKTNKQLLISFSFSQKVAKNIESAIYNMCVKLSKEYEDNLENLYDKYSFEKIGEIFQNPDKLDSILADINNLIIDWDSCVYDKYKEKESIDADNLFAGPKLISGAFTCKKCQQSECYYMQAQTRGIDEGATSYVVCVNCGNRWHF
jgi:DNA-directed RNA polymerase subunit M/transcription elongation factor TFIIS